VYSSDFVSPEQAELEFRSHLGMLDAHQECRHLKMRVGEIESHWKQNCLALGLSQGFIEPLEATALHLVQVAIESFINRFNAGRFSAGSRDDYNSRMCEYFGQVHDYIAAHYKLNTRTDTDYWRANRDNMQLPNSLPGILDAWYRLKDIGEIIKKNGTSQFDSRSWHCLLAGYGSFPDVVKGRPEKGDGYHDQNLHKFFQGCALNFAPHRENLKALKR
jgi:hypothetical protein